MSLASDVLCFYVVGELVSPQVDVFVREFHVAFEDVVLILLERLVICGPFGFAAFLWRANDAELPLFWRACFVVLPRGAHVFRLGEESGRSETAEEDETSAECRVPSAHRLFRYSALGTRHFACGHLLRAIVSDGTSSEFDAEMTSRSILLIS